jgi:hypothetical protein
MAKPTGTGRAGCVWTLNALVLLQAGAGAVAAGGSYARGWYNEAALI